MASFPIWKREGYNSENQYRNAKARELVNPETGRNFTSYRQLRDYRARTSGKARDYAKERERRNTLAQTRGYPSASRERSVKSALKKWGISYDEFLDLRRQNRKHWSEIQGNKGKLPDKFPTHIHRYMEPSEGNAAKFVGYVVSYYHAIVDPENNWSSVLNSNGVWESEDVGGTYVPKSNAWWFAYLVEYGDIYEADYYEGRYGKHK